MIQSDRSPVRARQDYVKAIYQLGGSSAVTGADLARYLGVSRAAVTKSRRLLEKGGLVKPAASRTERIELTARGRDLASNMLRRHRLIETFLHRSLNVPLDILHPLAESIEHVISDDVARRLFRFLGNPRVDPHGHPISTKNFAVSRAHRVSLADAQPGARVCVDSIPDRDQSVVRQLLAERVLPGLKALVISRVKGNVSLRSAKGTHVVSRHVAPLVAVTIGKIAEPAK